MGDFWEDLAIKRGDMLEQSHSLFMSLWRLYLAVLILAVVTMGSLVFVLATSTPNGRCISIDALQEVD